MTLSTMADHSVISATGASSFQMVTDNLVHTLSPASSMEFGKGVQHPTIR